jgi:hypothetical protein
MDRQRSVNTQKETIAMKASDLFLPKIARSDPEVRKAAVRNENDIDLLKHVSKKDSNPEVRKLALKRIKKLVVYGSVKKGVF